MNGKLIFYHGTVNSSKTMLLLSINFNYEKCNWKTITIKPALDSRSEWIETRAGIPPKKPDIVLKENESLYKYESITNTADVILIDECQFMSEAQIDELRNIATNCDIDILCFGLRTDSNAHLFAASKRLFELADEIIEVKTICSVCGKHASFNKKMSNNDNLIDPGWDTFTQVCHYHFLHDSEE